MSELRITDDQLTVEIKEDDLDRTLLIDDWDEEDVLLTTVYKDHSIVSQIQISKSDLLQAARHFYG